MPSIEVLVNAWGDGDSDSLNKFMKHLWVRFHARMVTLIMRTRRIDQTTAEQDVQDGLYRAMEELDLRVSGGRLLVDEVGRGVITKTPYDFGGYQLHLMSYSATPAHSPVKGAKEVVFVGGHETDNLCILILGPDETQVFGYDTRTHHGKWHEVEDLRNRLDPLWPFPPRALDRDERVSILIAVASLVGYRFYPFQWQDEDKFWGLAWAIWFRRSLVRPRPNTPLGPIGFDDTFASPPDWLEAGGPVVVIQRDNIIALVRLLETWARLLKDSPAVKATVEGIIFWVKRAVADCNPKHAKTPTDQLSAISIEDLLSGSDLVEFHADHESLVRFLIELWNPDWRKNVDQRLSQLRDAFASPPDWLAAGGPVVVIQRDNIVTLVRLLESWARLLNGRPETEGTRQMQATVEGIIFWVKRAVADCNPKYAKTPTDQLSAISIEDLLSGSDLVEFHADHESLVRFLMELWKPRWRNTVDQRLKRSREALGDVIKALLS